MLVFSKEKKGIIIDFSEESNEYAVGVKRAGNLGLAGISFTDVSEGSEEQEIKKMVLIFDDINQVKFIRRMLQSVMEVLEEQRSGRNE
ncbi:hypothetical protein CPJCM30710_27830 [Clostridium polyendosporum]|uniref:Uncharacterized protein n=1 Tax=Clostridium polyendosporum TaxID=69208 RepID=A0A919S0Z7_9CLOT|nr:hypothetical protein [Clostridium polyendosporum]GIM30117.1 hypothetical protein CPJCM30710_27830 [Clostridium polyendosporum]